MNMPEEPTVENWDSLLDECVFEARRLLSSTPDQDSVYAAQVWVELGVLITSRQRNELDFHAMGSEWESA